MNTQHKRFYIGTNSDYQLARQYIQQGKGCSISCHRGRGVVPCPRWVVAQEQHWDKLTQLSLSKWMKTQLELYPGCRFVVAMCPSTTKLF